MRSIACFDGFKGYLAVFDSSRGPVEFVTTRALSGEEICIDSGTECQRLLIAEKTAGHPIEWALERRHMGRDFARAYGARLYKVREGYEGAIERMKADAEVP
ncbi:hypothetical protein [Methylocystis echinoides]|uniref:Uncharacterized protein n=1 Tax=Methylocystis echinoides TaxID=29468 RepID=A0A9W6LTE7_9HYPH|nr:hypothetical protein [Methylocystis echinoides]GLI94416.1 hypothetical protein LMG27198_34080 [Methylocystis echinoides]